jgi:DNA-binding CsgD family transcriptional regulator
VTDVVPSAFTELSPQQQQIVRLAARGLTNREIGEKLFLSPRTVGSHLYRVFPKLGITARSQLRDVLEGTLTGTSVQSWPRTPADERADCWATAVAAQYLGGLLLEEPTPAPVQEAFDRISRHTLAGGVLLSPTTVQRVRATLRAALNTAVRLLPARRSVFHAEYASAPTSGRMPSVNPARRRPRKERG